MDKKPLSFKKCLKKCTLLFIAFIFLRIITKTVFQKDNTLYEIVHEINMTENVVLNYLIIISTLLAIFMVLISVFSTIYYYYLKIRYSKKDTN